MCHNEKLQKEKLEYNSKVGLAEITFSMQPNFRQRPINIVNYLLFRLVGVKIFLGG